MYTQPTVEDAQKWADGLRSGKYRQGRYRLENSDHELCCLGVACKIFIPDEDLRKSDGIIIGSYPSCLNQPAVPLWLEEINKDLINKINKSFSVLNDVTDDNLTFDEIADIVELVYVHRILD